MWVKEEIRMITIRAIRENPRQGETVHMVGHSEPCEQRRYLDRLLTGAILATVAVLLIRFVWRQLTLGF